MINIHPTREAAIEVAREDWGPLLRRYPTTDGADPTDCEYCAAGICAREALEYGPDPGQPPGPDNEGGRVIAHGRVD